jgi:hypothetical protein
VFESKELKKIFDLKRDEIRRQFMILHNEALWKLYWAHSIFTVIKLRRLW